MRFFSRKKNSCVSSYRNEHRERLDEKRVGHRLSAVDRAWRREDTPSAALKHACCFVLTPSMQTGRAPRFSRENAEASLVDVVRAIKPVIVWPAPAANALLAVLKEGE